MLRIECSNNRKNTVLNERNSFIACQGTPRALLNTCRVSKSNGKDILDYFINIYVHTELVEWLYRVNSTTACKCMATDM